MAAKLITLWLMASGNTVTDAIPMRTMDACRQASRILIVHLQPILKQDGYLKDVQFECQES